MRRSVEYAFENPQDVMPYVRNYAQAMDDAVMRAHIELYVTQFTADLGREGRNAVEAMFKLAKDKKIIPAVPADLFIK